VARSAVRDSQLDLGSLRLAPGSHSSPRDGICAVELTSLLAGESFSDRPRCVCKVIAGFMRSLNDRLAHAERQRLVPYAARALDSRGERDLTRQRRDLCLVWAGARPDAGPIRRLLGRLATRMRIWAVIGLRPALRLDEGAGEYAARVVFARYGTRAAFGLLERLLETAPLEAAPLADPIEAAAQARVAAAVRQLAGKAQAADGENGGHRAHRNGDPGDLGGRDSGQGHEEDIEDDRPDDGDPERETNPAQHPHDLARVP
jgi:hypothetical protein